MNNEKMGETIAFVLLVVITVLFTVILTEAGVVKRMKRQSIEGYVATAYYKTNSVGEVTIEKIDWEKK